MPVFLSLDLPTLHTENSGIPSEMAGRWSLLLEKIVTEKLQSELAGDSQNQINGTNGNAVPPPLPFEPVGR
jgi:hypothetical protein